MKFNWHGGRIACATQIDSDYKNLQNVRRLLFERVVRSFTSIVYPSLGYAAARYLLAIALVASPVQKALADTPLPVPMTQVVCSPSGDYCATSDIDTQSTVVMAKSANKPLWSIAGWHRWIFVSDDGESFAIGYEGMNLVPRDITLSEPLIYMYHLGELVRTIAVGDLFQSLSELKPTVSHYAWGAIEGYLRPDQLVVALSDDRYIAFDAKTGKLCGGKLGRWVCQDY